MQGVYDEIQELGAEVIAISVDGPEDALGIVQAHGLEYPVLYDSDASVTREWGIFNLLDDGVAAPAAYIFGSDGELAAFKVGSNIGERPTAQEVIDALSEAG